ncbi:MAG: glycerophosphodiester phosphodiesterase family protein [Nanoarchaeota archaeon]|nr:glycerophosphodiester phosphodiesterase family protein [Nanoarchaeota archaeon]
MAYEPENTLLSIKKAISLGVDGVEIDVRGCKSNEIVVIHDEKVNRTTNGKGYVKDFNLKDLKKLDAGKGEEIPTLMEIIEVIKIFNKKNKKQIKLIIELKEKDLGKDVVNLIKKFKFIDNVIIISFYHQLIKNIKKLNKKINAGILFVGNPVNIVSVAKDANADFLFANFNYIDANLIRNANKNKLKVYVWNVDDVENLKKMLKLNVDGIGSNKPDVIVDYLKKKR